MFASVEDSLFAPFFLFPFSLRCLLLVWKRFSRKTTHTLTDTKSAAYLWLLFTLGITNASLHHLAFGFSCFFSMAHSVGAAKFQAHVSSLISPTSQLELIVFTSQLNFTLASTRVHMVNSWGLSWDMRGVVLSLIQGCFFCRILEAQSRKLSTIFFH